MYKIIYVNDVHMNKKGKYMGRWERLLTISWHKLRPKKPVNEIQNHLL